MGGAQRQFVTLDAQPADGADGDVGQVGMVAEGLAGEHVGQVDLDERNADPEQGVAQGHAGVGECGRVDDDEGDSFHVGGVNPVDQGVLGVALEADQLMRTQRPGQFHAALLDVGEGGGAVDGGFAGAQQIQIRSVQQQQFGHRSNGNPLQIEGRDSA